VTSHTPLLGIGLDLKSQFPAHFQHHRIFLENLAGYLFQAFGFAVLDDQLHQGPAQASALEIRSQEDRILAGLMNSVGVEPDDAEYLAAGFIDGDKGHRARIIELRQFGDELMREFLDGIEKAKPQIFFGDVDQKVANHELVVRSDRPD
jgi:hypothetical protein